MQKVTLLTLTALLLILVLENKTSVVVERTAAQTKGSITGEVYLREKPEDGPGSLLIKIDNECKKQPCKTQEIDSVKVTFENIDIVEPTEMPSIPRLEDTREYKEFLRAVERMQKEEKSVGPGDPLRMPNFFKMLETLYPDRRVPAPALPIRQSFFDNSLEGKVEKNKDKLIFRFTYQYPPDKFNPTTGVRARANIPDALFEQLRKKKAKIEVENNGKVILEKKIKPQVLPKLEVEQRDEQESFLPNALVPGKPAYASFNAENAVGKFGKGPQIEKGVFLPLAQLFVLTVKFAVKNQKAILKVATSGGVTGVTVDPNKIYGIGSIPVTPEQLNKGRSSDGDRAGRTAKNPSQTTAGPVRTGKVILLTPPEAEPGDTVGVTIFNVFGEPIQEITFPEIKIVKPDPVKKNGDESGKSGDNSPASFPGVEIADDMEMADRMDDGNSTKDGSKKVEDDTGEPDETDEVGGDCTLSMGEASSYVIEGRKICVCGCFFNNLAQMESVFSSFTLDGKPIAPAACSPATASFQLPATFGPGVHKLTYKAPTGQSKSVEFRVIGVLGDIDINRLWLGQGTTMTLKIIGTAEALPLLIENKTPSIIAMTGGNRQKVSSSGGSPNQIQRQVLGISKGNFTIEYSLDQEPCPCVRKYE